MNTNTESWIFTFTSSTQAVEVIDIDLGCGKIFRLESMAKSFTEVQRCRR